MKKRGRTHAIHFCIMFLRFSSNLFFIESLQQFCIVPRNTYFPSKDMNNTIFRLSIPSHM